MTRFPSVRSLGLAMAMVLFAATAALPQGSSAPGPLKVHPTNKRYFTDGSGKAVYLTGSHTWATLHERGVEGTTPNFDYDAWLDFMLSHNHNFLRLWAWEHAQWMQFASRSTLVRYKPMGYARTGPGNALDGKPKFDVTKFNQAQFDRLRRRVIKARDRGIYVAVMLFQGFSIDQKSSSGAIDTAKGNPWDGHPFNPRNNINGINGDPNGDNRGIETHTLQVGAITALQEAYVRKVIDTVNDLDNVMFEIANESANSSTQWQYHMINMIKNYEAGKPKRHLVGMTFQWGRTGGKGTIANLFNSPADWISPNGEGGYRSNPPAANGSKIIVVDSDHIAPSEGGHRAWVWKTFLRGQHFILMDHYKDFRVGSPPQPLSSFDPLRESMGHTLTYARKVNLAAMTPRNALSSTSYCLADPGNEYLALRLGSNSFTVNLTAGTYSVEWFRVSTGTPTAGTSFTAGSGNRTFNPPFSGNAVLYLKRETTSSLPTVTVTAPDALASEPGANTGRFTVSRSGSTATALTVRFTVGGTASASDYAPLGSSLQIPAGDTSADLTVTAQDDSSVENDETVILTLSSNAAYTVGSSNRATVTIRDDDTPPPGNAGLQGAYYDTIDFGGSPIVRTDPTVDFDWATGSPLAGIGPDTFSVRWTGRVQAPFSGTFTFHTESDDGVRLWVDGELLVDQWVDQSLTEWTGSIALVGGASATLQMDYYENGGRAGARLLWSAPGLQTTVIPTGLLDPRTGPPDSRDNDGDGIPNDQDPDDDNDGIPDLQDPDRDGDGSTNVVEAAAGTDPDDSASFPGSPPPGAGPPAPLGSEGRDGCGATGLEILIILGVLGIRRRTP